MPNSRSALLKVAKAFLVISFLLAPLIQYAKLMSRINVKDFVVAAVPETLIQLPKKEGGFLAFVTYAHLMDFSRLEQFVFPTLDTWLSDEERNNTQKLDLYVVLNNQWKDKYFSELCPLHPQYCNRVQPVFVDCVEGKAGASPCCKQEKGLAWLQHTTDYQFYAYLDDDSYFRTRILLDVLTGLPPDDRPYLITGGTFTPQPLGHAGFLRHSLRKYQCTTKNPQFAYHWGQPVLYPRHTLRHVADGFRAGGLTKQCDAFNVTHDVGNAVFHWMYSLPELRMRYSMFPYDTDRGEIGTHGVGHLWQGQIAPNMTGLHERYRARRVRKPATKWFNVTGYHNTSTYSLYGEPSTRHHSWHTMPVSDCLVGGA